MLNPSRRTRRRRPARATSVASPVRSVGPAAALALALAVALLVAGCSSSSGSSSAASAGPSRPSTPASASTTPASTAPAADAAVDPPAVQLTWHACASGFECSTLAAPLDYRNPSAGTVDLALTRRLATDRSHRVGSLVVNPGGPGGSAVDFLQSAWKQLPSEISNRFDLVAFDPRGVGGSQPVHCLSTSQLDAYFHVDPSPDDPKELSDAVAAIKGFDSGCAARSGTLLAHVSTEDAARDMDLLRKSVGDERLTYLGYSYGTALGAEYLQRFPTRARALVLDGALDPTLTWDQESEGQAKGFEQAFDQFLAYCERTTCAFRKAVSGDLGAAFDDLDKRIDSTALPGIGSRTVGPGEFSLGVAVAMYSTSYWPVLGQALALAEKGDGNLLLRLSDEYTERTDSGYSNELEANAAVNCIDRPWPRDVAAYTAFADKVQAVAPRFGREIALGGLGCAFWPVPPVSTPQPVTAPGAPPIVVIGTTRDPATPYVWAQGLAKQLSSGVLVTFDGDGHTAYRASAPSCLLKPVDAYLLTGTPPKQGLSC